MFMHHAQHNLYHITRGKPYPLGATLDDEGVNFSLFSRHATKIELCLFDITGEKQIATIPLHWRSGDIWHCHVPGVKAGTIYGYRVHGDYAPEAGHRFNHHKLLLDPYAKALHMPPIWDESMYAHIPHDPRADLSFCTKDNAAFAPKGKVAKLAPMLRRAYRPYIPLEDTIIYETHVKGLTMLHPDVPKEHQGTFLGMSHPSVIGYLKGLGVTSIELLPTFLLGHNHFLQEKNLSNYWGYDPISFFILDPRFGVNDVHHEFRQMVDDYHNAGLEILLDVVYNHTGEHDQTGPSYSLRGIDNHSYYALMNQDKRYYQDDTGCGNMLDLSDDHVNQLVMDSLRYFVEEMHVDGFRFDLATTLLRDGHGNISNSPNFLAAIHQDPVLNQVKLIAEPWDLGKGGWRTGHFSNQFSEWNDRFRDNVRRFWNAGGNAADFVSAFAGSSNLFDHQNRSPQASINFITAHDGFTLKDLVSYNHKHNEDNKENNRDGSNNNISYNYGVEGETDDIAIQQIRWQQMRNFMVSLIFSQGVPMICSGDEYGRSKQGNNNTWCQDNDLAWLRWDRDTEEQEFTDFITMLIELRKNHGVFRRTDFFDGRSSIAKGAKDVAWLSPNGSEMQSFEWANSQCFGVFLPGDTDLFDPLDGTALIDNPFLFLFNGSGKEQIFKLPERLRILDWSNLFDTSLMQGVQPMQISDGVYNLRAHSCALWEAPKNEVAHNLILNSKKG